MCVCVHVGSHFLLLVGLVALRLAAVCWLVGASRLWYEKVNARVRGGPQTKSPAVSLGRACRRTGSLWVFPSSSLWTRPPREDPALEEQAVLEMNMSAWVGSPHSDPVGEEARAMNPAPCTRTFLPASLFVVVGLVRTPPPSSPDSSPLSEPRPQWDPPLSP